MKKNKEIVLFILVILCSIGIIFFYKESKSIKVTSEIKYQETGNVDYKVYLTDKQYYNKDYLNAGMLYISSIIDYIEVDYNYKVDYDKQDNYNITKRVDADIKILDKDSSDKVIYQKNEKVKEETVTSDKINVKDTIKINYKKYNDLTNKFKTDYGISANCTLLVTYNISYTNQNNELSQNKSLVVQIPLSEQMITISKSEDINNKSSYVGTTTDTPLNKLMFMVSAILFVVDAILITILFLSVVNRKKRESKYDAFVRKILREYDSYITEAKSVPYDINKSVINVSSFKELMDVRNSVEKAIVFIRIDNDNCKFILVDNEIYEYKITRSDLDK